MSDRESRVRDHRRARRYPAELFVSAEIAPVFRALPAAGAHRSTFRRFREERFQPLTDRLIMVPVRLHFRTRAFRRCKSRFSSLQLMTGHECVDDDSRADQWQRNKGEPNFRPSEILGGNNANL